MPTTPDLTTPSVVLRIVLYGATGAGTTSTVRALRNGLGQGVIGDVTDTVPELFDWLEYLGGRHDGQPILTQVIGVTGTDLRRRRALLADVDVVVFVADSTAAGMAATLTALDELRAILADLAPAARFVIQANRRDQPDALPVEELREVLELGAEDEVVETVAFQGEGVRQAFIYAVRSGLELVKERHGTTYGVATSPAELAERIGELDAAAPAGDGSIRLDRDDDPPGPTGAYAGPERRSDPVPLLDEPADDHTDPAAQADHTAQAARVDPAAQVDPADQLDHTAQVDRVERRPAPIPDDPATLDQWPRIVDRPKPTVAGSTPGHPPMPPMPPPPSPGSRAGTASHSGTAAPTRPRPAPPANRVESGGATVSPLARWWRALWDQR